MITNIKDNRQNGIKSDGLDFIIEPSSADNGIEGAQYHDPDTNKKGLVYAELLNANIAEAIEWGNGFEVAVTLFIYDKLHDFTPNYKTIIIDDSSPIFTVDG
jgi:hypothetical protein